MSVKTKYICDVCGEEAEKETFIIPSIQYHDVTDDHGITMFGYNALEPIEVNLCQRCQYNIANDIRLSQHSYIKV